MRQPSNREYEFGEFRLEPDERRLLREGAPVSLTPKAFDTLVLLVERAGHLVEKEELMNALWPDSFVEEANLAQHVWTLRKTLGETSEGTQFIETVARKGFRFVAPVRLSETQKPVVVEQQAVTAPPPMTDVAAVRTPGVVPSKTRRLSTNQLLLILLVAAGAIGLIVVFALARRRPTTPALVPSTTESVAREVKTIAVLPFKPISADSRNESLQMGMTETLITHVSNLSRIVVRPMGAVRKYDDPQQDPVKAGQELSVDAVLDGSIQKVRDRVRVTVRLTDVRTSASLWAEQFDEKFTDIFKVQDSIAEKVATTLLSKLETVEQQRLTKRYTDNPQAFELYLQAQYLWDNRTAENRQKMFQYYQQAIEKDPKFALAYVGMADLQITLVGDNHVAFEEVRPHIKDNLAKALALDSELAQARNLLAEVKYQFDYDWEGAEQEFKKAIDLNPNVASIRLAYSWYLMSMGRFDEATKEMQRAQELDPHSMVINRAKGRLLYFMHDFDASIEHLQRITNAEPNIALNHWVLAASYEAKRMYPEAVDEYEKAARINGKAATMSLADKAIFGLSGWNAYLQLYKDRLMRTAKDAYVSPMQLANTEARLGNTDEAFALLEKAVDERASGIPGLKVDPVFDQMHSDPRFARLLQRMNVKP